MMIIDSSENAYLQHFSPSENRCIYPIIFQVPILILICKEWKLNVVSYNYYISYFSSPDASYKLRFQSGATYNLFTKYKCTDLEGQYSLSASVSLSPPVLPSNRRKGAKKKLLPADLCITEVKVCTSAMPMLNAL